MIKLAEKDERSGKAIKDALVSRLEAANEWGVFSEKSLRIEDLMAPGTINVLDLSLLGQRVKSLMIGLLSRKVFQARVMARKMEEKAQIQKFTDIGRPVTSKIPMPWILIDEAHEYLPDDVLTPSARALVQIIREGRQPGITLVLATQQPGKIHTDVMTQADTVIAHRITAKMDTDALGTLMQSYMRKGLVEELDNLPREKGAAIVFDDTNERMYPIRVRPRFTWHGGGAPSAIKEKED